MTSTNPGMVTIRASLCAQGVYVWLVEGKYANGRPFKEAGDITLLH